MFSVSIPHKGNICAKRRPLRFDFTNNNSIYTATNIVFFSDSDCFLGENAR